MTWPRSLPWRNWRRGTRPATGADRAETRWADLDRGLAMFIQALSAKLGIATGQSLPALCRDRLPRPVTLLLWAQGELVAICTDLAEFLGGRHLGDHRQLEHVLRLLHPPNSKRVQLLQNGSEFSSSVIAFSSSPLASAVTPKVDSVTVTSATQAKVKYDLSAMGTTVAKGASGTSVLQDGTWKVGDGVFCGLLSEAKSAGLTIPVPAACSSGKLSSPRAVPGPRGSMGRTCRAACPSRGSSAPHQARADLSDHPGQGSGTRPAPGCVR
jgi:hypothetical protein